MDNGLWSIVHGPLILSLDFTSAPDFGAWLPTGDTLQKLVLWHLVG